MTGNFYIVRCDRCLHEERFTEEEARTMPKLPEKWLTVFIGPRHIDFCPECASKYENRILHFVMEGACENEKETENTFED